MRNIALILEYDGGRFHGWQSQVNARAVQDVVAAALAKLDGRPVALTGASRTDAGVHARGQVANFMTQSNIPADKYAYALNALMPDGVTCAGSYEAAAGFHARFSALGKIYSYQVHNRRHPSALRRDRAWHVPLPLDVDKMRGAAELLVGEHDFSAFMSAGSPVNSTVRTVSRIAVEDIPDAGVDDADIPGMGVVDVDTPRMGVVDADVPIECLPASGIPASGRIIRFTVAGNGFLYNMVRIIVGTLVYAGSGRLGAADIRLALETGDRRLAGKTAPPQGLCLEQVLYGPVSHSVCESFFVLPQ